jgi:hypothetical protein
MPTFYHARGVLITHRSMVVFDPAPTVYLLRELGPVWTVVPGPRPVLARTFCSSGAAAVAAFVVGGKDSVAGWVVAVVLLGAITVGLVLRRRATPMPVYTLTATWRGEWVTLYSTTDQLEFRRVSRAVRRALDWHDGPSG